jgi:hypothetical protein
MQVISLVLGILSLVGLAVGFLPCFGALNWLNIPFAGIGLIVGVVAIANARNSSKGPAVAGVIFCLLAILLGVLRLLMGGGIF